MHTHGYPPTHAWFTHTSALLIIQKSREIGHGDMLMQRLCPLSRYNLFMLFAKCCMKYRWSEFGFNVSYDHDCGSRKARKHGLTLSSNTQYTHTGWLWRSKRWRGGYSHVFFSIMHLPLYPSYKYIYYNQSVIVLMDEFCIYLRLSKHYISYSSRHILSTPKLEYLNNPPTLSVTIIFVNYSQNIYSTLWMTSWDVWLACKLTIIDCLQLWFSREASP